MAYAISQQRATFEFYDGDFYTTRTHEIDPANANPGTLAGTIAQKYADVSGAAIKRFVVSLVYTDNALTPVSGAQVNRMAQLSLQLETPGKTAPFFIPAVLDITDPGVGDNALVSGRSIVVDNPELVSLLSYFNLGTQMQISDGEDTADSDSVISGKLVTTKSNSRGL